MTLLGPFCALLSSFTWAVGSANYSRLTRDYSAFAINFSRAMVAFPCFVLLAFFFEGGIAEGLAGYSQIGLTEVSWLSLSVLCSYGLGDAFFLFSAQSLGVPGALAVASGYPIWTLLGGYFFLGQSLSGYQILGVVLTVAAVILVVLNAPKLPHPERRSFARGRPLPGKSEGIGVLLAVITSVCWATNGFASTKGAAHVDLLVANSIRMGIALVMSFTFGRLLFPKSEVAIPYSKLVQISWVFLFEAVLGSFLFFYGVVNSPLAVGTTLSSLSPIISVPTAVVLGLEKFSVYRTLAVVLAVIGICLMMMP